MVKRNGDNRGVIFRFTVPVKDLLRNPDDWRAHDEFVVRGTLRVDGLTRHWVKELVIHLSDRRVKRANREMQALIQTGTGGPGCPAGCRGGKPAHRTLAEVALLLATPHARRSTVHGLAHWGRVADAAVYLLEREPLADPEVVRLFALLHDTQRLTDGRDPDHGRRAVDVVLDMRRARGSTMTVKTMACAGPGAMA
jgi:hypothetical protein